IWILSNESFAILGSSSEAISSSFARTHYYRPTETVIVWTGPQDLSSETEFQRHPARSIIVGRTSSADGTTAIHFPRPFFHDDSVFSAALRLIQTIESWCGRLRS